MLPGRERHEDHDRPAHATDGLRKSQEDTKGTAKSCVGAIGRAEELDVYLARGCDTLTTEVCNGLLGRAVTAGDVSFAW